jgi:hypothetical protein
VLVLVALFAVQRFGTGAVARASGRSSSSGSRRWRPWASPNPEAPAILAALNPLLAVDFLIDRGWHVFAAVGAIVLALTGAEALYADMGHFGKTPIRLAWGTLVMPSLALNYMGQGALLINDPTAIANPFYMLVSRGMGAADRRARHAGGRDRVAGGDLGRVLDDASRPSSSASCRAWRSSTPRRARPGRSTCRASTGCCWSPSWPR